MFEPALVSAALWMAWAPSADAQYAAQGPKLTALDSQGLAHFGKAIAISGDGNTALIGGFGDHGGLGAAWVFVRSGGAWFRQGKLVPNDANGNAAFGISAALSADGNTAVVGGNRDATLVGAAWAFTRRNGVWSQQGAKLVGKSAGGTSPQQGTSVALSADGNTLVMGGPGDVNSGGGGAAWVFVRSNGIWSQQRSKLVGSGMSGNASFGGSVAVSADGNTALVGGQDDNSSLGATWVFVRSNDRWSQQGNKLVATDATALAFLGHAVALSWDGNTALVGGHGDNSGAGAAWVFVRQGVAWKQQGRKLAALGTVGAAGLGSAVALAAAGDTAVVGGSNDAVGVGASWVYARHDSTWAQAGPKLLGVGEVGQGTQGSSVAISADAHTIVVGGELDAGGIGAAWAFVDLIPTWETTSPIGTWYLRADGERLELNVSGFPDTYFASLRREDGDPDVLKNVSWDREGHWLDFGRDSAGTHQCYRLSLVRGVVAGRFSTSSQSSCPALVQYTRHVTGWSPDYLDDADVPRTWQITLNSTYDAELRIDRDAAGVLQGRLKTYYDRSADSLAEGLEYDLANLSWDGAHLSFTRAGDGFVESFQGATAGRSISGTYTRNGSAAMPWSGSRAEVLGFGLGSRITRRTVWQAATRARLRDLTEGFRLEGSDDPRVMVTIDSCVGCPFTTGPYIGNRDDNPNDWPPSYTLQRLHFSGQPVNRFDPSHPPATRDFYGYLSTPLAAPPACGYQPMIVLNGHDGSARQAMTQSDTSYWYGESAARRGFVVLAIDIGHRPEWEYGPIFHPAIIGSGYSSSDWEEDAERAFDVRLGLDFLATLPHIALRRAVIAGLSLGGEVATITAGLDTRISLAVSAGFSPDLYVMDHHKNHPCYLWNNADIHEYVDASDYEALIAPRPLVVETGVIDRTYSNLSPPFAGDKQVVRRARAAYGPDTSPILHYLHVDGHVFHVGDVCPNVTWVPQGVFTPVVSEPLIPGTTDWQTDSTTVLRIGTIYLLIDTLLSCHGVIGVADGSLGSPLDLRGPNPNPTRDWNRFSFAIPRAADVTLDILDVAGRRVRRLVAQTLVPGEHVVKWDGRNDLGTRVNAGVFWARLRIADHAITRQIVVVR